MKTCIYFVEKPEHFHKAGVDGPPGSLRLVRGFGFTPEGLWRSLSLPDGAAGLLLDDRFLPDRRGREACLRALADWDGLIVLDLEREPGPETAVLNETLIRLPRPERIVVPAAWAALPHGMLLLGPRTDGLPLPCLPDGNGGVHSCLTGDAADTLPYMIDGPPLRHSAAPGEAWTLWPGPLPKTGLPCPGPGCLQRRLADGSVLLWDTKTTLTARCRAAGAACLVFREDWDALPR